MSDRREENKFNDDDYDDDDEQEQNFEGGFASSPLRRRLNHEKSLASKKIDFGLQQVISDRSYPFSENHRTHTHTHTHTYIHTYITLHYVS